MSLSVYLMGYAHKRIGCTPHNRYTRTMTEVLRRIFAFMVIATLVAYLVFMIAGAVIYARAEDKERTVWIRDQITPNTHRISGLVTVPTSCTELTEKTEMLSPLLFKLNFTTWEDPNTECVRTPAQRQFYEIVFAPAVGVHFIATMDGAPLPIIVVPYSP